MRWYIALWVVVVVLVLAAALTHNVPLCIIAATSVGLAFGVAFGPRMFLAR